MAGVVLRKTKLECLELPGKERLIVELTPSDTQRAAYDAALRKARAQQAHGSRGGEWTNHLVVL